MLPKIFKPNNEYELIRLGSDNDGGYLVEPDSVENAKRLVSFGLGLDWSFEKDFFKLKNCPIDCYDHTIKYSKIKKISRRNILNFFKIKNLLKFNLIKKNFRNIFLYDDYKKFFSGLKKHHENAIGVGRNKKSLKEVINRINLSPIFLKIDIEGSEYRILNDILKFQNYISGLVIEFHNIDIHKEKVINFIENFKLNLCHVHGQNPGGNEYTDDKGDPIQIEMTFTNSINIKSKDYKTPHKLDQPADNRFSDIILNFEK